MSLIEGMLFHSTPDKMKLCLLFLAICVAYSESTACYAPMEWEGRVVEFDPSKKFDLRGRVSYDLQNRRERIVEEIVLDGKKEFEDVLYLHREEVEYRLNIATKKCTKRRISRNFPPLEVPTNATFYGEYYIGTSSVPYESVRVSVYGHNGNNTRYVSQWSHPSCLLLFYSAYNPRYGFITGSYYDITLGISNPNVFDPPRECV